MHVNEFGVNEKTRGNDQQPIIYISNMLHKFLDVLTNKPPIQLTPYHDIDHKIEVVSKPIISFSKATYKLNKKEVIFFFNQINDLMKIGYIRPNNLLLWNLGCVCGKKRWQILNVH